MAVPGSFPQSSLPLAPTEMMEQGRFIGWMAVPPDDPATEAQMTTGKLDLAKNAMFLPVKFSIDDVQQFRHRDAPSEGWGTETRTSKGRGRACIRGMRIPVSVVVGQVAHGASVEEILQGYPDLEPEDIRQALEYAAWLTREEVFSS